MVMNSKIILTGYAEDLAFVLSKIPTDFEYFLFDENTQFDVDFSETKVVVYVFSPNTKGSSQLLSRFLLVQSKVKPKQEFVLGINGVIDSTGTVFHFVKDYPVIS